MGNPIDDILDEGSDEEILDEQISDEEISTDGDGEESGDSESDEEISTGGDSLSDYKAKLIDQFGFDVSDDRDAKLLKKMLIDHKEKLKAVRQKSTAKQQLDEANKKPAQKSNKKIVYDEAYIDSIVDKKMEVAALKNSGLSEAIIDKVKEYSRNEGVSLTEAKDSDYIKYLQGQEEIRLKNQRASLSYKSKNSMAQRDYNKITAADFDMTDPAQRKEFEKWSERKSQNGNK